MAAQAGCMIAPALAPRRLFCQPSVWAHRAQGPRRRTQSSMIFTKLLLATTLLAAPLLAAAQGTPTSAPGPGPGWKEGECTGLRYFKTTTADAASCLARCRGNSGKVGCCRTEAGRAGKTAPFECFGHIGPYFKPSSAGADKDWSYVDPKDWSKVVPKYGSCALTAYDKYQESKVRWNGRNATSLTPQACYDCVMAEGSSMKKGADSAKCVIGGVVAYGKLLLGKECPAEMARCTGACDTELAGLLVGGNRRGHDPATNHWLARYTLASRYTRTAHTGITALMRCIKNPYKDTSCINKACANECGVSQADWQNYASTAQCACWLRPTCNSCTSTFDKSEFKSFIARANCAQHVKGAVTSRIKLAGTPPTTNKERSDFINKFKLDLGAALNSECYLLHARSGDETCYDAYYRDRISVTGIKAGSIVVDYAIAPNSWSGKPVSAALITKAFAKPGVKIGNYKTVEAVTAQDVSAPKTTAPPAGAPVPTVTASVAAALSPPPPASTPAASGVAASAPAVLVLVSATMLCL
jgi:hypothetical protein